VNLLKTLEKPGMNDVVQFTFYPVGGFTNPGINKSVNCPTSVSQDLPDPHCEGDKYETCLMKVSGCVDNTCPPAKQLGLSKFLDCFEADDGSQISKAGSCAKAAGFSVDAVDSCYNNVANKEAAWKSLQERTQAKRSTLTCFPWVEVDGKVLTDNCFGPIARTWDLLKALCDGCKAAGIKLPAACTPQTCASHPKCKGLDGDCCPTADGVTLACCKDDSKRSNGSFVV